MATHRALPKGRRASTGKGTFVYSDYRDNHVIYQGRDSALQGFVEKTYGGMQHKLRNAHSANSEDALTWSCFDTLGQLSSTSRGRALAELWELAFGSTNVPDGALNGQIFTGETYGQGTEKTEVDASIEGKGILVFIEAKLYSPMSQADGDKKPHNQIARKLRVGLVEARRRNAEFYFILLDIAPMDALRKMKSGASLADAQRPAAGFGGKWLTAYWFARYKANPKSLRGPLSGDAFEDIDTTTVARNMGWLTWADVFKSVLRAVLSDRPSGLTGHD